MAQTARRLVSKLPPAERRTLTRLEKKVPGWPLDAANWFYRAGDVSFTQALDDLSRELPVRRGFDLVVSSLIGDDDADRREYIDSDPRYRQAAAVLRHPEELVSSIMDVLDAFWRVGFGALWAREQIRISSIARTLTQGFEQHPIPTLLALSPRAVFDQDQDRLIFLGGQRTRTVDCSTLEGFDVLPSLWVRRRVVLLFGSERAGLCVSGIPIGREQVPGEELAGLLRSLAEPRRLAILRLCMREALCTQELAKRLGITEAPVSRHLRQLERTGFVVGQRFGRQVTYSAVPETVALLGAGLRGLGRESSEDAPEPPKNTAAVRAA